MSKPQPMDGDYGDRTAEAVHLFGKAPDYLSGYRAGKAPRLHSLEARAALAGAKYRGGDYLAGYTMARQVKKHGIKKALRKAKR